MNSIVSSFLFPLSPVLSMAAAGVSLVVAECIPSLRAPALKKAIAILGAAVSLAFCWQLIQAGPVTPALTLENSARWLYHFTQSYKLDALSLSFYAGIAVFTLCSLVFISFEFEKSELKTEILSLVLFVACGMMLLVSADSLLMIFLGLELLSLPTYALVGIHRGDKQSCEAAMKYFLFGSLASVMIVLSIAMLYAQFETLSFPLIRQAISSPAAGTALTYSGIAMLCIAVGFKVGMVPFHMWLPDAYHGAPTSITGFMGSGIKLAAFGLGIRLLWDVFFPAAAVWAPILIGLAVVSMFVGNVAALVQDNVKRMFAYSSISHAGYLMLGVASTPIEATVYPLFYYLVVYGLMFIGVMACVQLVERESGSSDIHAVAGLGFSRPFLGLCIAACAVSAAGIPPTAGFVSKYFVFLEAFRQGHALEVVLALISSLIGVYYYLRVVVYLYMKEGREQPKTPRYSVPIYAVIALCAASTILLAVWPDILQW